VARRVEAVARQVEAVARQVEAVARGFVRRVEAATPAGRDRGLDGLRALAIAGVVLGHWLVTALVADSGTVGVSSPLRHLPHLAAVSWLFQTLSVFFMVGGWAGARGQAASRDRGETYGRWLRARMARLFGPVTAVLAAWSVAAAGMLASGARWESVQALVGLVLSPLWFLLVFAVLTAATPLVRRLHPVVPLAVVTCVDVARFGFGAPEWLGQVNLAAGWLVPYCLGAACSRTGRRLTGTGWVMLAGGAAVTAGLVLWAGYPAAMVGVPGAVVSNLDPPTLAAVTFGIAQCGAALLLLGPLRRLLGRRPAVWAGVALVNLSAMTVFLWHQTALIAVTALGLLAGDPLPGLHTVPDDAGWVLARIAWLPVFALALLACCAAFGRTREKKTHEQGTRPPHGYRQGW
jgi:peptidoglycan/LPS O-acetylase OafA/YrhL